MVYGVLLVMLLAVSLAINGHQNFEYDTLRSEVSSLKNSVLNLNVELDEIRKQHTEMREELRIVRNNQLSGCTFPFVKSDKNDMQPHEKVHHEKVKLYNKRSVPTAVKGEKGDSGNQGPKGDSGSQGLPGPKGNIGTPGPRGFKGDTGILGVTGPKGDSGPPGPKGDIGILGVTGPKGDSGPPGPKGDIGILGVTGPKGDSGPPGPKGDTGILGVTGPKGESGPPGPKGDTGIQGLAGQKGDRGDSGITGPKGDVGPAGPKGDTGLTGSTGPKGTNRKIAFEAGIEDRITNVVEGMPIVFFRAVLNLGNDYDPSTGIFLCSEAGVYVFTWSIQINAGHSLVTALCINGQLHGYVDVNKLESGANTGSSTFITELNVGDRVYITAYTPDIPGTLIEYLGTTFSGYLLN